MPKFVINSVKIFTSLKKNLRLKTVNVTDQAI